MPIKLPFKEAIAKLARQKLLPTSLSSRELMGMRDQIRDVALFSARTTSARYLGSIYGELGGLLDGVTDLATSRYELKKALSEEGYMPQIGEMGTIKDLSSDARTMLVLKTNLQMAQGFGQRVQGMAPEVVDAFPCQELFRGEDRKEKRNWIERWRGAGGRVFAGKAPGYPLMDGFSEGRLIARKDDPVWEGISVFGTPYPPFDFNSGVSVRDVGYREAVELGVIQPGEKVAAEAPQFGENIQATAEEMPQPVREALLASLGPDYEFDRDVLKRK